MTFFRALLLPAALLALAGADGKNIGAIATFDRTFAHVEDYVVTTHSYESKDGRTQDRTYRFWFKKPHFAKTQVLSGQGKGSGAVWRGGDTVSGHLGGFISFVHLTIGLRDPRAVSLRGHTIVDGLIQNEVHRFNEIPGAITERGGPAIDGQATTLVDLRMTPSEADPGVARVVMYFSKTTHFPVERVNYDAAGKILSQQTWSDLRTNAGLKESDF